MFFKRGQRHLTGLFIKKLIDNFQELFPKQKERLMSPFKKLLHALWHCKNIEI